MLAAAVGVGLPVNVKVEVSAPAQRGDSTVKLGLYGRGDITTVSLTTTNPTQGIEKVAVTTTVRLAVVFNMNAV